MSLKCRKSFSLTVKDVAPSAYWKLDEASGDALDATGNGHVLTDNGGTVGVPGLIGNARSFVVHKYLRRNDDPDLTMANDFTILTWINFSAFGAFFDILSGFLFQRPAGEYYELGLYRNGGAGKPLYVEFDDSGATDVLATSDVIPILGQWYFVRVWWDTATQTIGIQVNNGNKFTVVVPVPIPTDQTAWFFEFHRPASFSHNFLVDETAYFKALISDALATNIYNAGVGKTCCPYV